MQQINERAATAGIEFAHHVIEQQHGFYAKHLLHQFNLGDFPRKRN